MEISSRSVVQYLIFSLSLFLFKHKTTNALPSLLSLKVGWVLNTLNELVLNCCFYQDYVFTETAVLLLRGVLFVVPHFPTRGQTQHATWANLVRDTPALLMSQLTRGHAYTLHEPTYYRTPQHAPCTNLLGNTPARFLSQLTRGHPRTLHEPTFYQTPQHTQCANLLGDTPARFVSHFNIGHPSTLRASNY